MDNQDHPMKNHTAGHDSHGVHLCHKCGWPFPNPHPSARHRRAHRKICGTIEGCKLIDSEGNVHLNVSDDEQSDEDHKSPSPKVLERSNNEKGSGGIGERSNRSEEDVFSDAAAEFPDSGSSPGPEEQLEDVKKPETDVATIIKSDTTTSQSYEDSAGTAIISPSDNSSDSTTIGLTARSLTDCRNEECAYEPNEINRGSACVSNTSKLETQTDALQQNTENVASEVLLESNAKGNEETNLNRLDDVVSPTDSAGESSGPVSVLGKTEDTTSDPVPAAGFIQSKEVNIDELDSKMSSNDISPEFESVELLNASIDTHIKMDATKAMDSLNCGNSIKVDTGTRERNKNVHVLSVPDDMPVVVDAEVMIKGFKDHDGGKLPYFVNADSFEVTNDFKDSTSEDNPSSYHLRPLNEATKDPASDVLVLKDNLEQKGGSSKLIAENLPNTGEADMPQVTINENPRSEELGAVTDALAIEMENSRPSQSPEEMLLNNSNDSVVTGSLENSTKVLCDVNPLAVPTDAEVRQKTNTVVGMDYARNCGRADEICDITGNDDNKRFTEEACTGRKATTFEPPSVLSEFEVDANNNSGSWSMEENPLMKTETTPESVKNLHEANIVAENIINMSDKKPVEPECTHLGQVSDTQEGVKEVESNDNDKVDVEYVGGVSTAAESGNVGDVEVLQKPHAVSENVIDLLESKLREPECIHLGRVLDTQEGIKGLRREGHVKVELDCVGVSAAVESGYSGDVDVIQNSSEEHVEKEPPTLPLDNSPSIQNSAIFEDNHERDFVGDRSEGNAKAEPESVGRFSAAAESGNGGDVEVLQQPSEKQVAKEPPILPSDISCSIQNSLTVENYKARYIVGVGADTQEGINECTSKGNAKLEPKCVGGISAAAESDNVGDVEVLHRSSEEHMTKELLILPPDSSSSFQNSTAIDDNHSRDFVGVVSGNRSEPLPDAGDDNLVAQQLGASTADLSVDSSSQTDSLEGHWGSVSVLSTQSDTPAILGTGPLQSNGSQASAEVEKAGFKKSKASCEGRHSDNKDVFEPPSFMTLVEPRGGSDQKAVASAEIQTAQNPQQLKPAALQTGWFPSLGPVMNESPGRKKNEEIIAKVTNWSTGKQHTPLKNLLGEANLETRKSPNTKESRALMVEKEETAPKYKNASMTTESLIVEPVRNDGGKEWNSPARYPSDIKREKRKAKGRPYWAQFVCCSSVN